MVRPSIHPGFPAPAQQGVLVMLSMMQVELGIGPHFIQVGSTSTTHVQGVQKNAWMVWLT